MTRAQHVQIDRRCEDVLGLYGPWTGAVWIQQHSVGKHYIGRRTGMSKSIALSMEYQHQNSIRHGPSCVDVRAPRDLY